MFHKLLGVDSVDLPRQFTYPFFYSPHPLCLRAQKLVVEYLSTKEEWRDEVSRGKMFGVLIVVDQDGEIGFLAAFSGQLDGTFLHDYFVPPIYDLNAQKSFFRGEEQKITDVNRKIEQLQNDEKYIRCIAEIKDKKEQYELLMTCWKERLALAKRERDARRTSGVTLEEENALVGESQFLKAQYKREKVAAEEKLLSLENRLSEMEGEISLLKEMRKRMSSTLQRRLFDEFVIYNARNEKCSLLDLFCPQMPPSGAGECAAPKLLQYAYLNHLRPVCMAEFWMGMSPKQIVRKQGESYPSCQSKCKPILSFMLQGLDVEPNPLEKMVLGSQLEIVWQDDELIAVNKPSGMLSVKGKIDAISAEELLQERFPEARIKAVHRLDQATSGILIFSKNEAMYVQMQSLFAHRKVRKRYLALLDGEVKCEKGTIELPLCLDVEHRPCQMVSYSYGKPALTTYEVLQYSQGQTLVWFYPHTGRTHQLRVHAAHELGLNAPIVGDSLYGKTADRLCLQAQRIEFTHPKTGKLVVIELPVDFNTRHLLSLSLRVSLN